MLDFPIKNWAKEMGIRTGKPRGRPKGSKDGVSRASTVVARLVKESVREALGNALDRLVVKSEETVEGVLNAKMSCGVCHGSGKTRYQPGGKQGLRERICQSCYGSGLERISPGERLRAALELMAYGHSKKQTIAHTGPDGGDIEHVIKVEYV